MKMRAGIVGPADMVEFICEIAEESNQTIAAVPFVYREPKDTTDIINKNREFVDVWIFPVPVFIHLLREAGRTSCFSI